MTATQRLADHLLDGRLAEYVAEHRAAGESWREISLRLHDEIGVDVTFETLRTWYGDDDPAAKAKAAS